jgi:hypothetical protein
MRPQFFGLSEIPQLGSAFSDTAAQMIRSLLPTLLEGDALIRKACGLHARAALALVGARW